MTNRYYRIKKKQYLHITESYLQSSLRAIAVLWSTRALEVSELAHIVNIWRHLLECFGGILESNFDSDKHACCILSVACTAEESPSYAVLIWSSTDRSRDAKTGLKSNRSTSGTKRSDTMSSSSSPKSKRIAWVVESCSFTVACVRVICWPTHNLRKGTRPPKKRVASLSVCPSWSPDNPPSILVVFY